ncbi:unnamed protein product, partial [Symbiodinium sp. KB8]
MRLKETSEEAEVQAQELRKETSEQDVKIQSLRTELEAAELEEVGSVAAGIPVIIIIIIIIIILVSCSAQKRTAGADAEANSGSSFIANISGHLTQTRALEPTEVVESEE